jgi:RNA polymerase sigma-B factor
VSAGAEAQPRDARAAELLAVMADPTVTDVQRETARSTLIEEHLPLVRFFAARFTGRGEPVADLVQVGVIGLIKAVDRFEVERGAAFASFASPTIIGEIRRHLRDRSHMVRLPRGLMELTGRVATASGDLGAELGRSPTPQEIAERLKVQVDDVLEALEAGYTSRVASLDAPDPGETGGSLGDRIPNGRDDIELVDQLATLAPLVRQLPDRDRRILELRFGRELSQSEIAAELGISQMHVSRLLARTLDLLRTQATTQA